MRAIKIVVVVVVLLVAAIVALPFLIDANQFRPLLESKLSDALGRQVKVGDLKLALLSGSVAAGDVSISDDPAFGREPFLRAKSLQTSVDLMPLILSRKLNVTALTIDRPEVNVVLSEKGAWNFATLGGKSEGKPAAAAPPSGDKGMDLSVNLVRINDGKFTLRRPGIRPEVVEDIDIELRNLSMSSAFDFLLTAKRAGGGSIKIEGKAGPLDAAGSHPPVEAKFTVPRMDLVASGLLDKSTGMAGFAAFSGSLQWKDAIDFTGKLTADQLKLSKGGTAAKPRVELDFAVSHNLEKGTGRLRSGAIHIGKAAASLTGTYDVASEPPAVRMTFAADKASLTELAAMLPALDVKLPAGSTIEGGTLTTRFDVAGKIDRLEVTGPLSIDGARLANFDLGTKMKTIQSLAGIPSSPNMDIQKLSADVKRTPAGTALDAITLLVPAVGELTGAGTVSPSSALDFKMRVNLHTSGALTAALGQKGDTSVPFLVGGTASNPSFKPDVKAIANEELKKFTKEPSKAVDAARGVIDLFRKKPAEQK
jgi:AsmA protein